jgi:hypothetical protein
MIVLIFWQTLFTVLSTCLVACAHSHVEIQYVLQAIESQLFLSCILGTFFSAYAMAISVPGGSIVGAITSSIAGLFAAEQLFRGGGAEHIAILIIVCMMVFMYACALFEMVELEPFVFFLLFVIQTVTIGLAATTRYVWLPISLFALFEMWLFSYVRNKRPIYA